MGWYSQNKPTRHVVCAGALGRVKSTPRVVPLNELWTEVRHAYEVLSVCTTATTYYNTTSWHYEEIKSSVALFSPIKLRKPTTASDPTHCVWAHDVSIRQIQVEVTLYLDHYFSI